MFGAAVSSSGNPFRRGAISFVRRVFSGPRRGVQKMSLLRSRNKYEEIQPQHRGISLDLDPLLVEPAAAREIRLQRQAKGQEVSQWSGIFHANAHL